MVLLALSSTAGGFVEAAFLVMVTGAAFTVASAQSTVTLTGGLDASVGTVVALAMLFVVLRLALNISSTWLSANLSTQVVAALRRQLASAYLSASWSAQHGERGGRFQELLTTFANRGSDLMSALAQTIIASCTLAALLAIAVLVDPLSSVIVVAAVSVLALILRPLRSAARRQARLSAGAGMDFATALDEISQLGMEMHVFNVQPVVRQRVDSLIDNNESTNRRLKFIGGMVSVVYSSLAYIALVGALGLASLVDSTSFEAVGAVVLVMLRSLTYGQAFQAQLATVYAALPFVEQLKNEIDRYTIDAEIVEHEPVDDVGPLRLRSVTFEYTPGVPALKDIDLEIQPGEAIGIVGPSGSGKTTLVHLLLGLRQPTEGAALAGGREITSFNRREWSKKVTLVPQQPRLIAGSIADNIRFMRDDITQDDIERAARQAQLHDDIDGFADGYDHQVGERGSHLSGGQQQRVIIARALAGRPAVLILDEPTSALDIRSEQLIRQALSDLHGTTTVIIIAHRLSTLEICDRIVVIQDGSLAACDSPIELRSSSTFYRESLKLSGLS